MKNARRDGGFLPGYIANVRPRDRVCASELRGLARTARLTAMIVPVVSVEAGAAIAEMDASAAAATAATRSDGTADTAGAGAEVDGAVDSAGADVGIDGETGRIDTGTVSVAVSDENGGTPMDACRAGTDIDVVSVGETEIMTELGLTLTLGTMNGTATEAVRISDTVTETMEGTTLTLTLTLTLLSGATRAGAETATELVVVGNTETAGMDEGDGIEDDEMARRGTDGTTSLLAGGREDGDANGIDDRGPGNDRIDRTCSDGTAATNVAVAGSALLGQTTTVVVTVTGGGHTTEGVMADLVADEVNGIAVVVGEGADPAPTATAPNPAPAPGPGSASFAGWRLDQGKICGTACGRA